jgi:hypothetical protein
MKKHLALFVSLLFVRALINTPGVAAQTPFISIDRRVEDVRAEGAKVNARFPVTLTGVEPDKVEVRLVDVMVDQRRRTELIMAFRWMKESLKPPPGYTPAIVFEVNLDQVREPAKYILAISVADQTTSDAKLLPFELAVNVPPATLRPPVLLKVERVGSFLGIGSHETKTWLDLKENSNRSRLTDVTINQTSITDSENNPVAGHIIFDAIAGPIAPNAQETAAYRLEGEFPFGTVRGGLEILAPQLANPVPINFEVRTRAHPGNIVLIIIVGLLVGWFTRIFLQQRIELDQVLLAANEVQQRIRRAFDAHQDAEFRKDLQTAEGELKVALKTNQATAITNATQKANTDLSDALNRLNTRRAAVQTNLAEGETLTKTHWALPAEIARPVQDIAGQLNAAREALRVDNVGDADAKLESMRADLAAKLETPVMQWRDGLADYLNKLSDPAAPLPESLTREMKSARDQLKLRLDQVADVTPHSTTGQIRGTLDALHSAHKNAVDLMTRKLGDWLQTTTGEVTAILETAKVPDLKAVEKLKETISQLQKEAAHSADDPIAAQKQWNAIALTLDMAWRDALLKQIPNASADEKAAVEQLIKNRKYADAANKVADILKPQTAATGENRLLGGKVGGRIAARAAALLSGWLALPPMLDSPALAQAEPVPLVELPLEIARRRTLTELMIATFLQTLIVGLLIAVAGYLLYEKDFIGTFTEVVKIFFWAFALDVTVGKLMEIIKPFKPS